MPDPIAARQVVSRIPGEPGIWVLIIGDFLVFSLLFIVFGHYRRQDPQLFFHSHMVLNRGIGLANTLVLLTSSVLVALSVQRMRRGANGAVLLWTSFACALTFIGLKLLEYSQKLAVGITPMTDQFYTLYFAYTGIHLAHVLLGTILLGLMAKVASRIPMTAAGVMIVECGAILWHLIDLLWIMLFAIFYLVG